MERQAMTQSDLKDGTGVSSILVLLAHTSYGRKQMIRPRNMLCQQYQTKKWKYKAQFDISSRLYMAGIQLLMLYLLLLLAFLSVGTQVILCFTDPRDGTFPMRCHFENTPTDANGHFVGKCGCCAAIPEDMENTPPSWNQSDDPCGAPWEGVPCTDSRVIALGLSAIGLKGKLIGDIGGLTELTSLDLSNNLNLVGSLPPRLGDLKKLNTLVLVGCGFSGEILQELGNLAELSFLGLNSNNFTGGIPPSLGKLTKLYWLDLPDNQLTGTLPISSSETQTGLDQLLYCKHFHFSKNQLSGPILEKLFSANMKLIHILFDENQLNGSIPSTIGLDQTLEVLRLDRNALTGNVPSNLSNLVKLVTLNLAHNKLTGPLPNLSLMTSLSYIDLSNNSFEESIAPVWFSTLPALTTWVMEYGPLQGPLPPKLFSFQQLQAVLLRNNAFNGTLNMNEGVSPNLLLIDLQNNNFSSVILSAEYKNVLMLLGNPVCNALANTSYCQPQPTKPYCTSLENCRSVFCSPEQKLNPQTCDCACPFEGTFYFKGATFKDLSNVNKFHSLEMSLCVGLGLSPGSVFLCNPIFNANDYLQVQLALFPTGKYFNLSEVRRIGFALSNQTYKPPSEFGPYYFSASPYAFPGVL